MITCFALRISTLTLALTTMDHHTSHRTSINDSKFAGVVPWIMLGICFLGLGVIVWVL